MKGVLVNLNIDGVDTYLTVELENSGHDCVLVNIEQRDCGVDTKLNEQVVSVNDLRNLRDAIDFIINKEESDVI